jgi:hypothetical protein
MPTPTVINKYRYSDVINRRYWDNKYFFTSMSVNPIISKLGGGAAAGASAETDVLTDGKTQLEYFTIVGNTNIGPKIDSTIGWNLAPDATNTHGLEYNTGTSSLNNFAFTIDTTGATTPAFFVRAQFTMATAAGATLLLGFRKVAANNATLTSYTDFATIGVIAGEFETETQLASGGAITTDTTQAAANATQFQLTVFVDSMGNVTYAINGVTPTVTVAYQFANALVVMPFIRIVQNSTTTATIDCNYFECGFQS